MLILLTPEQVSQNYSELVEHIKVALPETLKRNFKPGNLLNAAVKGLLKVWVYAKENEIVAVITTTIHLDPFTETKSLYIYTLSSSGKLSLEEFKEGLKQLSDYAKQLRCSELLAAITAPSIAALGEELGFKQSYTLLQKEV